MDDVAPAQDTVVSGPFWPEPVRVVRAAANGASIRIEAVGISNGTYYDLTLTADQLRTLVREERTSAHAFDADPTLFRLATEALRTQLAHVFDPQFAVSVSQVDPLPHQLDAVYRHMLALPRIRFLLADDPGAGKTIMAGLLMRELMQRHGIRRVLVLCPKALTDQWRREMWERFRARFMLLTGESISGTFGGNAWLENDLVVASVDLAIQPHIQPGLEQASWDLVIFDEAHKLSAYRYGAGRIDKTRRYLLAEKLAGQTGHLLLMTATPHKGNDENFRLLLALLDPTVFATQRGMRKALEDGQSPYFLRRMKESMHDFDGKPLFLPRHVKTVKYDLEPHEQALYDAVTAYVATGLRQAESSSNRNVSLALTVLQRRLASSLFAITRSLERRQSRLTEELQLARAGRRPALRETPIEYDVDDEADELTEDEEEALSAASNARNAEELAEEIGVLDGLIAMARGALASERTERKLSEFLRVVESQTVRGHDEKILVFSEHRDTMTWITQRLQERGYSVVNIHGGMKLPDRIAAEKAFKGDTQFLVATDAAGEGINLQFCRVMVNWDLPWNPNRLEQRMGRIHRYGQQYEVHVYNLVAQTTLEGKVLIRLMDKLDAMRDTIGHDQVYDVISGILDGSQIRLDLLIRDAILSRRSLDDILAEFDSVESESGKAAAREVLGEALATRHIDLAFIAGNARESKERRLTPEYVERFFADGLRYLGGRVTRGPDRDWRLEHVPAGIRAALRAAPTGEIGDASRSITFYKERLRADPPAELVAPGHPLFDAVVERILDVGRAALLRGSAFVDPEAREAALIWLLEAAVVNGDGDVVHKRLLALRQCGERFEPVAPGVILDLPPEGAAPHVPDDVRALAVGEAAVGAASGVYAGHYLAEVSREQERQAGIVERALRESVDDELTRLQERLDRQHADAERGKEMRLAIQTTNQEIDALTAEHSRRQLANGRRRVTAIETPRVVGVAAVLPPPIPRAWALGAGGDRRAVELAAMRVAADYEIANGRQPADVSQTGVGYDIRSEGPAGEVRYIEVKGHAASGDIVLYYTEWQTAQRMRDEFFIYNVDRALTEPRMLIVQDPVGHGIQPVEKVVEYAISASQLRAAAGGTE